MKDENVVYQIKSLDKMILRNIIQAQDVMRDFSVSKTTPTQIQIIEYILDTDNKEVNQNELENVLKLRRATVSGVLQTMEKNNLITRGASTEDARTKKIKLNKKAEEFFISGKKRIDYIERNMVKGITKKELNFFLNIIDKMKNNIENIDKDNI